MNDAIRIKKHDMRNKRRYDFDDAQRIIFTSPLIGGRAGVEQQSAEENAAKRYVAVAEDDTVRMLAKRSRGPVYRSTLIAVAVNDAYAKAAER